MNRVVDKSFPFNQFIIDLLNITVKSDTLGGILIHLQTVET